MLIPIDDLAARIDAGYKALAYCINEEATNVDLWMSIQREIKDAKAKILREEDPKALGSNEAQREAKIVELLASETQVMHLAERRLHSCKTQTEMARLETDRLKLHVRLHEASGANV